VWKKEEKREWGGGGRLGQRGRENKRRVTRQGQIRETSTPFQDTKQEKKKGNQKEKEGLTVQKR